MIIKAQSRLLVVLILVIMHLPMLVSPILAQESSPVAEEADIVFGLVAVGDHPEGFFNDVEILPGQTETFEVDVMNLSNIEISFDVYVTNALNAVNGGFVADDRDDEITDPASWIEFDSREIILGANEVERVSFVVTVPEGTPSGQYISAMVMSMQDTLAIPGTDVLDHRLEYAISIGILVPGELTHSFELGQPTFLIESRTLSIPITNTGNYLLRPEGKLTITDAEGNEIAVSEITMGSVYAGLTTSVGFPFPPHIEGGDVLVTLELTDPSSGYSAQIVEEPLSIAPPALPDPITIESASITPNDDEIVFANVDIIVQNATSQIPATNVNLIVLMDGEEVDSFPLATNQVLLNGSNTYSTRYIPMDMWESGTYTFRIEIYSVNPDGGTQIELLVEVLDAEIVVP